MMQNREIVEKLIERGIVVATAESCTGGLISSTITDVPGSSAIFGYGMVTYSNEAKMKILGVKEDTLKQFGAVSKETAYEMAEGLKKVSSADVSISVTGIAGPGGGSEEKPVGLVYMGIATKEGIFTKKNLFNGDRDEIRKQTVHTALNLIAEKLGL
ncbi:MAG: CinA family protein [Firmicutes bacterium]|nr:CinA family protein [Bacillota bacterium]MBQ6810494.1 CinA family protein [Bacillota bacterium]